MKLRDDLDCYYVPLGDGVYQPTLHVQGAWLTHEQHMAPVAGLIAHAIEAHDPRADLQLARLTFEILGQIPAEPSRIDVEIVRPGRTIELVAATMVVGDRPVIKARAWRLVRGETQDVAGHHFEPMPDPSTVPVWDMTHVWSGGYIRALEVHIVPGAEPGRARAWMRVPYELVAGEPSSPTVNFVRMIDAANGIATRVSPKEWMFPNTDLTVHLFRTPTGPWVGLDTQVTFGPTGVGLTSTTLHDIEGPVGRAEQILTVRPMP